MTLAFWDSSALVKLLVDEADSDDAERLWNQDEPAAASRLVVPEVGAALAVARRSGRLDGAAHRRSLREWTRLQEEVEMMELTPRVAGEAVELATSHPLSGADAVHLASVLSLGRGSLLVTWDQRLASAATAVGLAVAPIGLSCREADERVEVTVGDA